MELQELRKELDTVDAELLRLFVRRMELCGEVGAYKRAHGLATLDASREEEKLSRAAASVPEKYAGDARRFMASLMAQSRALQDRERDGL